MLKKSETQQNCRSAQALSRTETLRVIDALHKRVQTQAPCEATQPTRGQSQSFCSHDSSPSTPSTSKQPEPDANRTIYHH